MSYLTQSRSDFEHSLGAYKSSAAEAATQFRSLRGATVQESGVRVLVVDDHAPWSHFISSMLQQNRVGVEALEKSRALSPDLVLLDISLPDLNGIEVAKQLAALAPAPKIIFISEHRDPDIVREALHTGACGYVLKSSAARDLMAAIETVLADGTFVSDHLGRP